MFCAKCGHQLNAGEVVCPNCGYCKEVQNEASKESSKEASEEVNNKVGIEISHKNNLPIVKKRRRGCLIPFIIFFISIIIIVVGIFYFVPGFSRPVNLGVNSSKESYQSVLGKLGYTKDNAPTSGKYEDYIYVYGPVNNIDSSLTSDEITSFFNENRPSYYALKNVQVLINNDNSVEVTGNIDTNYILNDVLNNQYSKDDINKQIPLLGMIPDNVSFYIKASGGITNNTSNNIDLISVKVMGIPLPSSITNNDQTTQFINETINNYLVKINSKSNTYFESIQISNGQLQIKGQIPSSITRTNK